MKKLLLFLSAGVLAACNMINIKPGTMERHETIMANRGGYDMQMAVKPELEKMGYKVIVGKMTGEIALGSEHEMASSNPMGARYVLRVWEKVSVASSPTASLMQAGENILCLFSGIDWWAFNMSIADQKTGEELLSWSGQGCKHGMLRKFRKLVKQLEK